MALTAKVTPSFTWPDASKVTLARLRLTARPTVELLGTLITSQLADGAVTLPKLDAALRGRFVNVKDAPYGAVGDGVTNDTPSIMLALATLKAAGGGVLRIPKGRYLMNKTVDGYAIGQYEAGNNYALLIDFPNCIIEGDGMGLTVLVAGTVSTTIIYGSAGNIGIKGITFEQGDASTDFAACATTLSRTGLDPNTATNFIDQGWTLATMIYFVGTPGAYISNIFVQECELLNPVRYGIGLGWAKNVRFANNLIKYYDGFLPPVHAQTALGAGRVGIFSGHEHVQDVTVVGNNFNGNVAGTAYSTYHGSPPGTIYYTQIAADGFVWFGLGGNITVTGNTIRNYALEACNLPTGPVVCSNNVFTTVGVGTPSAVAMFMAPSSPNDTDVDKRTYVFNSNTVIGGAAGFVGKGPIYAATLPCPYFRAICNDNIFEGVTFPVGVIGAEVFECNGNISTDCTTFFTCDATAPAAAYPLVDFRSKFFVFADNVIVGCTAVGYHFSYPMQDNGVIVISGGVIQKGLYHAGFVAPTAGTTYNVLVNDVVFVDSAGLECAPLFNDPISPDVKFVRHFGRPFHTDTSPRTPALGYRKGDVLRNTARSKGGVLFWEAIGDGIGGATFEPVFSACRGVMAQGRIYALSAATPVELLPQLEGQAPRMVSLSVINAKACTWSGGGNTVLRVRTKPVTGSPITLADIPIAKLITGTTLVAQADITFFKPADDVGGFGGATIVGSGIEVVGWDTVLNSAVNLVTNAANTDGPVVIAAQCFLEYATSV